MKDAIKNIVQESIDVKKKLLESEDVVESIGKSIGIIVDVLESGNKILILTSRRDFTIDLNGFINNSLKIKCDYLIGGKDICQDSEVIIATYQKVGVGFDLEMSAIGFSGIKIDTLILYFSTRMLSLIEQLVGRILRSNEPKVIDIVDDGSIFENHFRQRMKYYSTKKLTLYKYNNS